MQDFKIQVPQIPPEVARYLKGPSSQSNQYDFLIGDWVVTATRYQEGGISLCQYKGNWSAKYLNSGTAQRQR